MYRNEIPCHPSTLEFKDSVKSRQRLIDRNSVLDQRFPIEFVCSRVVGFFSFRPVNHKESAVSVIPNAVVVQVDSATHPNGVRHRISVGLMKMHADENIKDIASGCRVACDL